MENASDYLLHDELTRGRPQCARQYLRRPSDVLLRVTPSVAMNAAKQRSKISIVFRSTARLLFTTLIFTAGGMGLGLLLGIIVMVTYGLVTGVQPDMRNAYRHVAIPLAIAIGCAAFLGALVLEVRAYRTRA